MRVNLSFAQKQMADNNGAGQSSGSLTGVAATASTFASGATTSNKNTQSTSNNSNNNSANQSSSNNNQANSSVIPNNCGVPNPATFVPLTRARKRENIDNQFVIDINTIDESCGSKDPARKARLSSIKLTEEEYAVFSNLIKDDITLFQAYIYIRNSILEAWFENVHQLVDKQGAYERLDDSQIDVSALAIKNNLFERTFEFLDRTGKINYGLLPIHCKYQEDNLLDEKKRAPTKPINSYKPPYKTGENRTGRVIVIGAGFSGLIAARQLQRFGMEVIVLEAKYKVGGRVCTYKKGNFIADYGPSSLNGVLGNPLVTLGKQAEISVMELKQKIPIYEHKNDRNGQSVCYDVDPLLDRAIEREYNKIIEGTRVMKVQYGIERIRDQPYSVGTAVNWVMTLQEKNVQDEMLKHLNAIVDLYNDLIKSAENKLKKAKQIKTLEGQLCSMRETMDVNNHKDRAIIDTFQSRCVARDLDLVLKEYKVLLQQEAEIHSSIAALTKCPPSDTYLSLSDRHLLEWHFAELEYALGCPISKLGIYYEDDEEIFDGPHYMLVHGFNQITEAMKQDLNIMTNTAVKKVIINKDGCRVLTYQQDHSASPYVEYTADAVLCTVPLGVLQDSLNASQEAATNPKPDPPRTTQKGYQPMIFEPTLPRWKHQAIQRLGCGNLNKIVMSFDKIFWDTENHLFGVVSHTALSRGEFFLFWHSGRTPTLTSLISGEAAEILEGLSDMEILERCLILVRSIFGANNVPAPKDYIVTKWRKDPWARGAWSYLKTGSSGIDYDILAEPCVLQDNGNQHHWMADRFTFKEINVKHERKPGLLTPSFVQHMKKTTKANEIPRLFFAGEHTTRLYFASAHGAVITGLREAARIANIFLGCPYDPNEDEPGVIIS